MDKFRKEEENFQKFKSFILNLPIEDAKDFIIKFFEKYKYLLDEEIGRIMDKDLLYVIKQKQHKYIAVIAENVSDFNHWIITNTDESVKKKSSRHFTINNVSYIGIVMPENVISYAFDDVIETGFARRNKKYSEIMNIIIPSLTNNT